MASEPASRSRPRWQKALLALAVGSAAALVLAELTVRIVKCIVDPGLVTASQLSSGIAAKPAPGQPYRLGHLIRAARNPDIIFELLPGLDVEFMGVRVVTNADGFRGPQRSRDKPANGYRIVGLGDSVLFGWGVPYEASGLAVLEAQIQAACPTRIVEAVDTAVPGYNTAMEEQVLRDKGLAFAPDLVIVDFVGNDFDLPNYLWQQPDYLALDHSFLWDLVRRGLSWKARELHGPFVWAPVGEDGDFESRADHVPKAYRHLVGPEAYRRALQSIASLGKQHGFHVLVTCHHDLWPEARAICGDVGVPFMQMGKRVDTWLHENGHKALLGSPLTINPEDPHPSTILHAWWAEQVFLRLQELGWLPDAKPR